MRGWLLALLCMAGCGGTPVSTVPIEVAPAMYLLDKTLADVHDGDTISLEFPPQGGHVLFVGARVKGLDTSLVTLRGRLRSVADDSIFAEEARTVELLPSPEDPMVRIPDLRSYSNVANVPVCPSYSSSDLYDKQYTLEVVVTEVSSKRTGTGRRVAVPSCLQPAAADKQYCQCDCAANYVLGKCNM